MDLILFLLYLLVLNNIIYFLSFVFCDCSLSIFIDVFHGNSLKQISSCVSAENFTFNFYQEFITISWHILN